MTIIVKYCSKCGHKNIIVRNLITKQKERDKAFGFIGESIEVYEGDSPKCEGCGICLML